MAAELVLVTTSDEVRQSLIRFNSEAKQFRDRALSLLHQTTYWVYDDDSEQFGPAKFVGFDDMSFEKYEEAVNRRHTGARFDGFRTRRAIESALGVQFSLDEELPSKLEVWAHSLLGSGAFEGVDRTKWTFVRLRVHPNYWALAANPQIYDIEAAIAELDEDDWTVHNSNVRAGDRVLIWKAKGRTEHRGIVALGEVLTDAAPMTPLPASRKYHLDVTLISAAERRVRLKYLVPSNAPLWLEDDKSGLLASLSVARATGGSVFKISSAQWEKLVALLGGWQTGKRSTTEAALEAASLTEIIQEIERRAETREIGRLQEIRQELKGHARPAGHSIFTAQSIFEEDGYAFHHGGRTELQFNVGFEQEGFRHGVAFSLEASRALPEPEKALLPSVRRFNEYLTLYPEQFSEMSMWNWDGDEREQSDHAPSPIQPDLLRRGVFVFMGRLQPTARIDYDLILDDFDRLLPLYRFVEGTEVFPKLHKPLPGGFQFKPGCSVKPVRTTGSLQERELDITLRHNELQRALHDYLVSLYGAAEVGTELYSADGHVDVVLRRSQRFWFYEIKTAMSAQACIRQALAQLLEYAYWPGAQEAEKLIIVGEPPLDNNAKLYLSTLKQRFSLPIEYEQFNMKTRVFSPHEQLATT